MKLTNHIAIRYIGMSTVILLLSIPFFYFVLQRVMQYNTDESMSFQKEQIKKQLQTTSPQNLVSFNNNIIIRLGYLPDSNERFYSEDLYISYEEEIEPYRIMEFNAIANGRNYIVRIQKSMIENEDILQAIVSMQLSILFLLLLSLLFIDKRLNKKVWQPFYKTLDALRHYRIDKDNALNLPDVKITEITSLNHSINELTKHSHQIFTTQKEFTENASHELQTPLAIMQSNLDLLWQTSPISKEQMKLLENLTETNNRMNKLNKTLLLLAKIENQQYSDKKEINISNLIEKILIQHEEGFIQKNIQVTQNLSFTEELFADESLMQMLLGNLISNALRYTPKNGRINIIMQQNKVIIGNTATKGPLDKEKLFKRFQKQNNTEIISTGLGLEICKRICKINSFHIQYNFSEKMHWFKVEFS